MIVKMQWPITTTAKIPTILIYNRDRSFWSEYPINNTLRKLFQGKLKIYCKVTFNEKNELYIDKVIKNQDW